MTKLTAGLISALLLIPSVSIASNDPQKHDTLQSALTDTKIIGSTSAGEFKEASWYEPAGGLKILTTALVTPRGTVKPLGRLRFAYHIVETYMGIYVLHNAGVYRYDPMTDEFIQESVPGRDGQPQSVYIKRAAHSPDLAAFVLGPPDRGDGIRGFLIFRKGWRIIKTSPLSEPKGTWVLGITKRITNKTERFVVGYADGTSLVYNVDRDAWNIHPPKDYCKYCGRRR